MLTTFINKSKECIKFNLDSCQLNSLRKIPCENISKKCKPVTLKHKNCLIRSNISDVFTQDDRLEELIDAPLGPMCCSKNCSKSNKKLITGLVVGTILIFFTAILIIFHLVRKFKTKNKVEEINLEMNENEYYEE